MKKIPFPRAAAAVSFLILAASPVFAQEKAIDLGVQVGEHSVARVYRIQFGDLHDAMMSAHQICLAQPGKRQCEYRPTGRTWFTYWTDPPTQERIAAEIERLDRTPASLNFRLTLLLAGDDSQIDPNLPPQEKRALADIKKFLPYKGYRLLDAGWIRSGERAELRLGTEPTFEMEMHFEWNSASGGREIQVDRFQLTIPHEFHSNSAGKVVLSSLYRKLIQSSFSMKVGETVVVGTSKLNGGQEALVVLLTAEE